MVIRSSQQHRAGASRHRGRCRVQGTVVVTPDLLGHVLPRVPAERDVDHLVPANRWRAANLAWLPSGQSEVEGVLLSSPVQRRMGLLSVPARRHVTAARQQDRVGHPEPFASASMEGSGVVRCMTSGSPPSSQTASAAWWRHLRSLAQRARGVREPRRDETRGRS